MSFNLDLVVNCLFARLFWTFNLHWTFNSTLCYPPGSYSKQNYFSGYIPIYSLRLRDSRDSQDSETPETPRLPRLLRLRDSRGFCHITFQFSFISDLPLFQIFQILQILKWKWKWKDPTFAIFLKNMGFKDVEYNIPETLRLPRLPRLWDKKRTKPQNERMPDHLVPSKSIAKNAQKMPILV